MTADLLKEEGVPFGALEDPDVHARREILDLEQKPDEAVGVVARERLEAGVPIDNIAAEIDRTFGPDPDLTEDRT